MKLAGAKATAFFAKPDKTCAGLLIFGMDAEKINTRRQEVTLALVGKDAMDEMRLTRIAAGDVRKDPALVLDAIKAQGFFPGPRAVVVEGAGDGLAALFAGAVADWIEGDAYLIVTAGSLNARSKLRKVFEASQNFYTIGIYDDPTRPEEVDRMLVDAKLTNVSAEAKKYLLALARDLGLGDFKQVLTKLSLYKLKDDTPVEVVDVQACAPATLDADIDDVLHMVAEARSGEVGPTLSRLSGQGVNATALCIGAMRHFRMLHAAVSDPQGPDVGFSRARPPVFGPRKDRLVRQARGWGGPRLEKALQELMDTDLMLRSSKPVPAMAVVERAFIRLAMMRPK
ncbi:MAG: DNA polymerase III subunit delta [Amylibacter sp.]|nr:DNA polymerase III subunit delta [Amylibacter sp.]